MTYEQAVELAKRREEEGYQFLYESTYRDMNHSQVSRHKY